MKIITDNPTLLRLVPNVATTVEGESTLYDKITPWLMQAEEWVSETFTGGEVLTSIAAAPTSTTWQQVAMLIVSEAMRRAIPHLDVVLTPNGFGIVSNQNVAPASKERVERLIESQRALRDHYVEYLLGSLSRSSDWHETYQCSWFSETLIQSPQNCVIAVHGKDFAGDRWEAFLALRDAARPIEAAIAEKWLSESLMYRLRRALPTDTAADLSLAQHVRRCVIDELKGQPRNCRALDRIVNYVRQRPEEYPEWVSSATAELFAPPVFRNTKESKGYFF